MTDAQKAELERDRDKALIREALKRARIAEQWGREKDRDLLHRLIARIEGPEYDGL